MRSWQPSDLSGQRLEESGRNLTAVLTRIRSDLEIRAEFKQAMSEFYKDFSDLEIETYGGLSRVVFIGTQSQGTHAGGEAFRRYFAMVGADGSLARSCAAAINLFGGTGDSFAPGRDGFIGRNN